MASVQFAFQGRNLPGRRKGVAGDYPGEARLQAALFVPTPLLPSGRLAFRPHRDLGAPSPPRPSTAVARNSPAVVAARGTSRRASTLRTRNLALHFMPPTRGAVPCRGVASPVRTAAAKPPFGQTARGPTRRRVRPTRDCPNAARGHSRGLAPPQMERSPGTHFAPPELGSETHTAARVRPGHLFAGIPGDFASRQHPFSCWPTGPGSPGLT